MAPEQLKGTEVTAKSDIYALGLVLYEIFTGRKPYDAKSVKDLISQQESATLTSMTSIAADIDPAVEHVIRRCLDPDPAKRPESALSVSAALPGGDPLAAALAAGETPSPQLVAASGKTEGMAMKYAWLCLAMVIVAVIAAPILKQYKQAFLQTPLEYPPDVLKQKARDLAVSFGYTQKPADTALWLDQRLAVITYLDRLPSPRDWKKWLPSEAPAMAYYRESQVPMVALPIGTLEVDNPPVTAPGSVLAYLELGGRLRDFRAVPYTAETSITPVSADAVIRAAGFDPTRFTEVAPSLLPTVPSDTLKAFKGPHPAIPGLNPQVEIGWWKGRLTWMRIVWPWTSTGMAKTNPFIAEAQGLLLPTMVAIGLFFMVLFARRNWNLNRADRRGAFLVGVSMFGLSMASWVASVHVVESGAMRDLFGNALADSVANGAIFLVMYLAIEPALRLRWPHAIITWNRVLAGQWSDAQVGSHILIGLALGSALILFGMVRDVSTANSEGLDTFSGLYLINGTRFWIGGIIGRTQSAISTGIVVFCVLFSLRQLLRRDWLAAIIGGILFSLIQGDLVNSLNWQAELAVYIVILTILAFALLRFGLLATMVAVFALNTVNAISLGTDWSTWYAPTGFATIGLLLLLTLIAFRNTLGERELF
jgi:serine/threonine-protein kinase